MNKHIQLIKSEADMPGELIPNAIIMNGMDKSIKLDDAVTRFEGVKEFTSLKQAEELNHYNTVGAVLSYDNGVFKAWNGDPENLEWNYKEFPDGLCVGDVDATYFKYPASEPNNNYSMINGMAFINETNDYSWIGKNVDNSDVILHADIPITHGTPIAVCVGKGLWYVLNWESRDEETGSVSFNTYQWANAGSDLYNNFVIGAFRTDDGAEASKAIYGYGNESPLFANVKNFEYPGNIHIHDVVGRCFVPSSAQNREIWLNIQTVDPNHYNGSPLNDSYGVPEHTGINFRSKLCCALLYSPNYIYWSSSQFSNIPEVFVMQSDGIINSFDKSAASDMQVGRAFVCLHFGDTLVS